MSEKKPKGRPKKEPLSLVEHVALIAILALVEEKAKSNGLIEGSFLAIKNKAGAFDVLSDKILKYNDNTDASLGWDFWKNLIKIGQDKIENAKKPLAANLELLGCYALEDKAFKWDEFLFLISRNIPSLTTCTKQSTECTKQSTELFIHPRTCKVDRLEKGEIVVIGWIPQCYITAQYLGEKHFRILYATSGHELNIGNEIEVEKFKITLPTINGQTLGKDGSIVDSEISQYALPIISYDPPSPPMVYL